MLNLIAEVSQVSGLNVFEISILVGIALVGIIAWVRSLSIFE
jgi:hypothetical protein